MSDSITPSNVRAARALLGWSQATLAGKAGIGVSTVADFERGARTPVASNLAAMREAFETERIAFRPGGVKLASSAPLPPPGKALRPLRWISAHDLAEWSSTLIGRAKMPELISRLLLATYGPVDGIRFPSDESTDRPGWDGVCILPTASIYLPAGPAGWEIGTQRGDIAGKADGDYTKRTADPLGLDPAASSFVFVTPRPWPAKEAWLAKRKAEGYWRNIVVIDGDMLVHWLELCPGVAQWLAELSHRRPTGLRSLSSIWDEWALATHPALPRDLILLDRDEEAAQVWRWLNGPPSVLALQAEASDEAMAFVHAAITVLPPDHRDFWLTRQIVAASNDAAERLIGIGAKLIVHLDPGNAGLAASLVQDGHHVLRALGSDMQVTEGALRLARPWRYHIESELEAMGLDPTRAHQLAGQCGRSLAVLRRLIPSSPARYPSWAASAPRAMVAAMLAGGWHDDNDIDRAHLEGLAGMPYSELTDALKGLAETLGGPLRRSGNIWKLASLRDSWFLLAKQLGENDVSRLCDTFLKVMREPDPAFERGGQKWWEIPKDIPQRASLELRRGLCEAMIALGVYPDQAKNVSAGAQTADRMVTALLGNADEQLWWSLSHDFQLLSEAAPRAFFTAIDDALDAEPTPLRALFRNDEGFIHPTQYLADLLWALELHCWKPDYLSEVSLLLARLAECDPDGSGQNRPAATLRRIFLPWSPQTAATAEQRIAALDLILRRYPMTGWQLLLAISPTLHDVSHPTARPRWRDYGDDRVEPVTRIGIAHAYRGIGERVLAHVGRDAERWTQLLEHWANYGPEWRQAAAAALANSVMDFDGKARLAFRESLRGLIAKHERAPGRAWAMDDEALAPLRAIFEELASDDLADRHGWLFRRGHRFGRAGESWEESNARLQVEQRVAAKELADSLSADAIIDFSLTLDLPDAFGTALTGPEIPAEMQEAILDAARRRLDDRAATLARAMAFGMKQAGGDNWIWARFEQAAANGDPLYAILPLMRALPHGSAAWSRVAAAGANIEHAYWKDLPGFMVPRTAKELGEATQHLLAVGRGRAALAMLAAPGSEVADIAYVRAALRAASTIDPEDETDADDPVMMNYYVELAFKRLDADASTTEAELVQLEWIYYPVLEDSERPPRLLHKALSADPKFFLDLLEAVFGPAGEDASEGAQQRQAAMGRHALRVLEGWNVIPGAADDGSIDGAVLEAWVKEARRLTAAADLADVGDSRIGQMLSSPQRVAGVAWPPEPIREIIEICRSRDLESGFEVGVINRRGVTMRGMTDGGAQERNEALEFREHAMASALAWPRTRALLERIAETLEAQGRWHDQHAEQRDWI